MQRFVDKVVIVTGGASGIGEACTRAFAGEGARVLIADIDNTKGDALSAALNSAGGCVKYLRCDITSENEVDQLISHCVSEWGRIDVLVNNAGIGTLRPTHEQTFEYWRKVQSINLDAVFLMTKRVVVEMLRQGGGNIVNMASIHGHLGYPHLASYCASKGGVVNFTRATAVEYAPQNIRINAVCPGLIRTPINQNITPEEFEACCALYPMGRIGEPHEVANAVLFLASDAASFITGSSLIVDGGYTAI